jgi:hypothetical protein
MAKHLVVAVCVLISAVTPRLVDAQRSTHERRTLVQLSFVDHANYSLEVSWVNEKLLCIRVPWGRILGTDLVFDVETGRFVYRESHNWGQIEFEQWKAPGEPCVVPPEQFSK